MRAWYSRAALPRHPHRGHWYTSPRLLVHSQAAANRDRLEHIACRYAGPGRWNAPELTLLITKVDAILAPGCASFNQLEGLPAQGMKGMRDPKRACFIDRITCS